MRKFVAGWSVQSPRSAIRSRTIASYGRPARIASLSQVVNRRRRKTRKGPSSVPTKARASRSASESDVRRSRRRSSSQASILPRGGRASKRRTSDRKGLFFKPFAGFGSRAAYRGDKVTQRVWSEIVAGGYVAQALIVPGERAVDAAADRPLKFDLRQYVYEGEVQWTAARLYQGQTTNFRTPGGGFAPVYEGPP